MTVHVTCCPNDEVVSWIVNIMWDDHLCDTKCDVTVTILWKSEEESLKDSIVNEIFFLLFIILFLMLRCPKQADAIAGKSLLVGLDKG